MNAALDGWVNFTQTVYDTYQELQEHPERAADHDADPWVDRFGLGDYAARSRQAARARAAGNPLSMEAARGPNQAVLAERVAGALNTVSGTLLDALHGPVEQRPVDRRVALVQKMTDEQKALLGAYRASKAAAGLGVWGLLLAGHSPYLGGAVLVGAAGVALLALQEVDKHQLCIDELHADLAALGASL